MLHDGHLRHEMYDRLYLRIHHASCILHHVSCIRIMNHASCTKKAMVNCQSPYCSRNFLITFQSQINLARIVYLCSQLPWMAVQLVICRFKLVYTAYKLNSLSSSVVHSTARLKSHLLPLGWTSAFTDPEEEN